jgi:hypothetical protein
MVLVWAMPALALQQRDEEGYIYWNISLSGLWGGFFFFLFGIFAVLVGLFLYFAWRRSDRQYTQTPLTQDGKDEEDEQVF